MAINERLTEQQKLFIDYYITSLNATESYKKAYGCKYETANVEGSNSLKKPKIKKAIGERLKELESVRIADAREVMELLTRIARGEEVEEFITTIGTGKGVTEVTRVLKKPSVRDRLKALELLGKRYKLFTEKVEMDMVQQVIFTDEEELQD